LQFGSGGHVLCCSRIRKNVKYRIRKNITYREQRTDRQRTEKAITEATLIPWIAGLSGPISSLLYKLKGLQCTALMVVNSLHTDINT